MTRPAPRPRPAAAARGSGPAIVLVGLGILAIPLLEPVGFRIKQGTQCSFNRAPH